MATIPTSVTESMEDITELPPEFVEFSVAMKRKGLTEWKLPEGIIQNTVELLYSVVAAAYNGSMICLTQQCERANENLRFSSALADAMSKKRWRFSPAQTHEHLVANPAGNVRRGRIR